MLSDAAIRQSESFWNSGFRLKPTPEPKQRWTITMDRRRRRREKGLAARQLWFLSFSVEILHLQCKCNCPLAPSKRFEWRLIICSLVERWNSHLHPRRIQRRERVYVSKYFRLFSFFVYRERFCSRDHSFEDYSLALLEVHSSCLAESS